MPPIPGINSPSPRRAQQRRNSERSPILDRDSFVEAHLGQQRRVLEYRQRANARQISNELAEELKLGSSIYLHANNMQARISFMDIAVEQFEELFDRLEPRPVQGFWLTLTPGQFAIDEGDAKTFDIKKLIKWTQRQLRGLNYVGAVDMALYSNKAVLGGNRRAVSWHVHVIVWGCSRQNLKLVRGRINSQLTSLIPTRPVAHFVGYNREKLMERVFYMLAAPMDDYRVGVHREEVPDPETGELRLVGTFKQYKGDPKPGHIISMYEIMKDRLLDKLLFGGGEGIALAESIRSKALKPFRHHEARDLRR